MRRQLTIRFIMVLAWAILAVAPSVAQAGPITVLDPGTYIVDQAGLVPFEAKQRMEELLKELQDQTQAQVKVLTVRTTGGEDFFSFVQRHAEKWALGQQGKDIGALIVLALEEREARIHTGYGLEAILPDSWCGTECRRVAGQYFKQGAYADGLDDLVRAVASRIANDTGKTLTHLSQGPRRAPSHDNVAYNVPSRNTNPVPCLFTALIVIAIIVSIASRISQGSSWWDVFTDGGWNHQNSRSSSGFGSGGFFGGSSGGSFYRSGGGGSFGGGGGGAKW